MAILRPDLYKHQNPNLPIVDGDNVIGGRRTVANRAALYALASKSAQLREGVTIVRISSDNLYDNAVTEVLLVSLANVGAASGWELHGNGVVAPYTDEQAQDAFGDLLQDSATIQGTYDDAGAIVTFDVRTDSIGANLLSPEVRAQLAAPGGDTVASLALVGTTLRLTTDGGTFEANLSSLQTSTDEPAVAGDTISAVSLLATDVLRVTTDQGTFDVALATFRDLSKATGSLAQAQVTGLVAALAGKSNTNHTHSIGTSATPGFSTNNYNDLTNKPSIPAAYTDAQAQQANDARFDAVEASVGGLAQVARTGSYNDLSDKPTIPTGGVTSVNTRTGAVTLSKADVGLANVDNTSDANKPISTATQTALNGKEPAITADGDANKYWGADKQFHSLPTQTGDGTTIVQNPGTSTTAVMSQDASTKLAQTVLEQIPEPAFFYGMSVKAGQVRKSNLNYFRYTADASNIQAAPEDDPNAVQVYPDALAQPIQVGDTQSVNLTQDEDGTVTAEVNLGDTTDIDLFSDSEGVKAQFTPARKAALANVSQADPALPLSALSTVFRVDLLQPLEVYTYDENGDPIYFGNATGVLQYDPTWIGKRVYVASGGRLEFPSFSPDVIGSVLFIENSTGGSLLLTADTGDVTLADNAQAYYIIHKNYGDEDFVGGARLLSVVYNDNAGSGTPTDSFDPYDLTTAKANQVIADYTANGGPIVETDEAYYECRFTDDFTSPGDEFLYWCTKRRPATEGGPQVWKWGRYLETGV